MAQSAWQRSRWYNAKSSPLGQREKWVETGCPEVSHLSPPWLSKDLEMPPSLQEAAEPDWPPKACKLSSQQVVLGAFRTAEVLSTPPSGSCCWLRCISCVSRWHQGQCCSPFSPVVGPGNQTQIIGLMRQMDAFAHSSLLSSPQYFRGIVCTERLHVLR